MNSASNCYKNVCSKNKVETSVPEPAEVCQNCVHANAFDDKLLCRRYPPPVNSGPVVVAPDYACGEFRFNKKIAQQRYAHLMSALESRRDNETTKPYNGYTCHKSDYVIAGYRLIQTCGACPEQYDVFDDTTGLQVGYLRLRHGEFRADSPRVGGVTVYHANTNGDGEFDAGERLPQLKKAVKAIKRYLRKSAKRAKHDGGC